MALAVVVVVGNVVVVSATVVVSPDMRTAVAPVTAKKCRRNSELYVVAIFKFTVLVFFSRAIGYLILIQWPGWYGQILSLPQ